MVKIAKKSASNGYKKPHPSQGRMSSSVPIPPTTAPAHMGHSGMSKSQEQRPKRHRSPHQGIPFFSTLSPNLPFLPEASPPAILVIWLQETHSWPFLTVHPPPAAPTPPGKQNALGHGFYQHPVEVAPQEQTEKPQFTEDPCRGPPAPYRRKQNHSRYLLGLGLLSKVLYGQALLSYDRTNKLRGHQHPQWELELFGLRGAPRGRAPLPGGVAPAAGALGGRRGAHLFVRDVGNLEGIVLKLVAAQLLNCSAREGQVGRW